MCETRDITKEFIFWLPAKGYEGLYLVSEYGDVYSIMKRKVLAQATDRHGYKRLTLCNRKIHKGFFVHRIVAYAFIPEIEGKNIINHLDENPANNHFTNLAWCTQSENMRWGNCPAKRRKANLNHPGKSKPVCAINDEGNVVMTFPSIGEAGRSLHIDPCSIVHCLHGRKGSKHIGGYGWRYKCECLPQEKSG